jgi:hypothetical protein
MKMTKKFDDLNEEFNVSKILSKEPEVVEEKLKK